MKLHAFDTLSYSQAEEVTLQRLIRAHAKPDVLQSTTPKSPDRTQHEDSEGATPASLPVLHLNVTNLRQR